MQTLDFLLAQIKNRGEKIYQVQKKSWRQLVCKVIGSTMKIWYKGLWIEHKIAGDYHHQMTIIEGLIMKTQHIGVGICFNDE